MDLEPQIVPVHFSDCNYHHQQLPAGAKGGVWALRMVMPEGHGVNDSSGAAGPSLHRAADPKAVPSLGKPAGHLGGAVCVHRQNQFGTGTSLR